MKLLRALVPLFVAGIACAEPPADWLGRFKYLPSPFEAKIEKKQEREEWTQSKVEFPSAFKSGVESNDTVHAYLVEPRKKNIRAAVIVLPIWKGGGPDLELIVARRLAKDGIAALVVALPYQFERAPAGERSGNLTVSADLERTQNSMIQAVQDVQRAAAWLSAERGVPDDRVGITGISLGGHVAALAWAVCPQLRAACTVLAGGNVHELIWNESDETKDMKEALAAKGMTIEKLAELTKPFDAVTYATKERKKGLLMIGAKDDPVVPIRNVRALRDAFGGARMLVYPGNHYSAIMSIGAMLDDISGHFVAEFGAAPEEK